MNESQVGNSAPKESLDISQVGSKTADSSDNFFETLEQQVNGSIADVPVEATPVGQDSNIADPSSAGNDELEKANKRYSDSSREAQKMKAQLDELKPFMPVLEVMKKDSGLVDTVREYLINGGKPSETVSNKLKLPEDFVFDSHEAMVNPDSNSAKVMDAYVDKMVQVRTKEIIDGEKKNAQNMQMQIAKKKQAEEFKKKHNMGEDEFKTLVEQAKKHRITLDDVYYILNKDKVSSSVANQTKQDMLAQMKNVRNIPQSQSSSNNAGSPKGQDDNLFDSLLGLDNDINSLFDG